MERIRIVVLEPAGRLRGYAAPPIGALRDAGAKAVLVEPERGLAFDVITSKLTIPGVRRGSVSRTALVNRLRAAGAFPCVMVVAPAGYGKTTVLAQWAAKDARPFAWLSIDARDNDPIVLLRHLVAALDSVDPIEPRLLEALGSGQPSVWSSIMPRLAAHLAAGKSPFVLVLDDVDLLESKDSIAIVTTLIENLPRRSMAALAGRRQPNLPVASFRVGGPLLEFGPFELALSRRACTRPSRMTNATTTLSRLIAYSMTVSGRLAIVASSLLCSAGTAVLWRRSASTRNVWRSARAE